MEPKRFIFSLFIAILISASISTATVLVVDYTPINDPNDPYVVEIAKFAVSEHNKDASNQLIFIKVLSGQQEQVVAGTNYKLRINAKIAEERHVGVDGVYEAVVYDKPSEKYRSLTSFSKVQTN